MGNFYVNYTVRGASAKQVTEAFAGRNAAVTREEKGCVVAVDEESDSQDMEVIGEVGRALSEATGRPVLAVLNHDDDILAYKLWESGKLSDEYDSCPNYFSGDEEDSGPKGGDAAKLCKVFGASDVEGVEMILRSSFETEEPNFVFAIERHTALAEKLRLPLFGVGFGYRYLEGGELPEGLTEKDVIRIRA